MEKLGRLLTSTWATLIVATLLVVAYVANPKVIQTLQLKTFDLFITSLEPKKSDEIVLVEFGEKSVEAYGQWPFDRRDISAVIERLRGSAASVIVLPILFSEKDRAGGDLDLEQSLQRGGVVISQTPTTQRRAPDAARRGFANVGNDPGPWLYTWPGAVAPLGQHAGAAEGVGLLAVAPELDGVVRRLPMLARIGANLYPSLVLETLRVAAGDPSYQIKTGEAGVEAVRVPAFPAIATDQNARIWLTWNNTFDKVEATEIDKRVEGKVVIVGLTIEGVGGIVATPVGEKWAHEIQAQALQTVVDGTSITRLPFAKLLEQAGLVVIMIGLLIAVPRTSVKWTVPVYVFLIGSVGYGSYYLFKNYLQLWDPSFIVVASTFVFGHLVYNNFAREFRLKQQIKKQFGSYLSPDMVEKLQKNPELLKLGGDTRELSIMFTDVRGFTAISEHYGSNVQGLTSIMNRYMSAMTESILEQKGTLDKYIGDAQMAFWNAPLDDPEHAKNALRAALNMLGKLDAFNKEISTEGVPPFGMGIGINSGNVVVGNMGSVQRFDYTCLGDTVNLASRLEGQSKPYGVKVILGPLTAEHVKDEFATVELDTIAVKGKKEGVKIYTVLEWEDYKKGFVETHNDFLRYYYKGDWNSALKYATGLKHCFNNELEHYYEAMIERIEEYKKTPPQNWDGVYRATSK